jgi:hypothetical protein
MINRRLFMTFLCFCPILGFAQVGIGTSTPNASAGLEISASSKGFLPPRVTLTGTSDNSTISSPATGLLVYNTATAGVSPANVTPGYYYYDGAKWQRFVNQQPDATVSFDKLTPTTSSVVFTPNIQGSTDYIYVSSVDASQWTWNGTSYVTYTPSSVTSWYLKGGTSDAGSNKTNDIYRTGKVGIGAASPTTTLEVGSTTGTIPGEITINPQNGTFEGGQVTLKKSRTGSTLDWTVDQFVNNSIPRFRIFAGADENNGISIWETGKMTIKPLAADYSSQTESLLVNGTAKITGNLNAAGTYYAVAGLGASQTMTKQTDNTIAMTDKDDPNGWWDATNYRFLPNVAGNYFISVQVSWTAGTTNTSSDQINIQLRKNGNTITIAQDILPLSLSRTQRLTAIVSLNGTTDYLTVTGYSSSASDHNANGDASRSFTNFSAYKIN